MPPDTVAVVFWTFWALVALAGVLDAVNRRIKRNRDRRESARIAHLDDYRRAWRAERDRHYAAERGEGELP